MLTLPDDMADAAAAKVTPPPPPPLAPHDEGSTPFFGGVGSLLRKAQGALTPSPQDIDPRSFGLMGGGNPFTGLGEFTGRVRHEAASGLSTLNDAAIRAENRLGISPPPESGFRLPSPVTTAIRSVIPDLLSYASGGASYVANNLAFGPGGPASNTGGWNQITSQLREMPGLPPRVANDALGVYNQASSPVSLAFAPQMPIRTVAAPIAGVAASEAAKSIGASEGQQRLADFAAQTATFSSPEIARGLRALNGIGDVEALARAAGPAERSTAEGMVAATPSGLSGEANRLLTPVADLVAEQASRPGVLETIGDVVSKFPAGFGIKKIDESSDEIGLIAELKRIVAEEDVLRRSGQVAREISANTGQKFGQMAPDISNAGYGERIRMERGALRVSVPDAVRQQLQQTRPWVQEQINQQWRSGAFDEATYNRLSSAVDKAFSGVGLQPKERQALGQLIGEDAVTALAGTPSRSVSPNIRMSGPVARAGKLIPQNAASLSEKLRSARDSDVARQAAAEIAERRSNIPEPPSLQEAQRMSGPVARAGKLIPQNAASLSEKLRSARDSDVARQAAAEIAERRSNIPEPPSLQEAQRMSGPSTPPGAATPPGASPAQIVANAAREGIKPDTSPIGAWEQILDILNIPRTVKASFDLSAPFRQGAVLSARNPQEFWGAWYPMIQAFGSESVAEAIDREISSGAASIIRKRTPLYIAPLKEGVIGAREEAFASRLALKIPGIEHSERAYITFLNKLRADVFDKNFQRLVDSGLKGKELDSAANELARFTNWATGRGEITGRELVQVLGNVFFSPKLLKSRIDVIRSVLPPAIGGNIENPLVRQIARENVGAWAAQNATILGLISASGASVGGKAVSVELDPRSSDFGKLRVGPTRIDPWAGFQQMARGSAQFVTGQRKTSTGEIIPAERLSVAGDFARSKLNPVTGTAVDQLTGSTMVGQSLDTPVTLPGGAVIPGRVANALGLFTPLAPQDTYEAVQGNGALGAGLSVLGDVGMGVQTYSTPAEKLAQAVGKPLSEMTPSDFQRARDENPELARQLDQQTKDSGNPYQQAKQRYAAEQIQADQTITDPKAWRDNRHDREMKLLGVRESQPEFKADTSTPWGQYYQQIKQNTVNGQVDWNAVDAWRATLPAETNAKIDSETGLGGSPREREYRADVKQIVQSGYWKLNDEAAQKVATAMKIPGVQTEAQLKAGIAQKAQEMAGGNSLREHRIEQELTARFDEISGREHTRFLLTPEGKKIGPLLVKWGYGAPRVAYRGQ